MAQGRGFKPGRIYFRIKSNLNAVGQERINSVCELIQLDFRDDVMRIKPAHDVIWSLSHRLSRWTADQLLSEGCEENTLTADDSEGQFNTNL